MSRQLTFQLRDTPFFRGEKKVSLPRKHIRDETLDESRIFV
ncbi:hypothetical protein SD78_0347 [Bacillus badius]|nr:hypothetical protein SD78_0347 [Bacillus badius]